MKDKTVFYNPFRIISPKLNKEASRLEELFESPPTEVTCLEEGLLVMVSKLMEMSKLIYKSLIIVDAEKVRRCQTLAQEVHNEEKGLTGDLVCSPATTGAILKTLVLFPGHLERCGDLLESALNCANIKARDGVSFSDKAHNELTLLFDNVAETFTEFRRALGNPGDVDLLRALIEKEKKLAQMTLDFAIAHEDRLLDGLCSPKSSSLYLDILDSLRGVSNHLRRMTEGLLKLAEEHKKAA